ncbi:hypothetical protein D3874_15350 [Oleomonas cavernae]|uniref:Uncharacterized protein n=1 Tax=Oleomonas cavernae TaxID=2320859 RepID=A0A418WDY0_9PROT|nr:hypothetical protein [Oleomonas cavernae]RJF88221.1 hypothetical protein D3874_15350 [Oleomonas cavernae]
MNLSYRIDNMMDAPAMLPVAQLDRFVTDLLVIVQRVTRGKTYGLVDRESCRRELGLNDAEFEVVIGHGRQRGYIDSQAAYGRLSLTRRGIERLAQIWR